MADPYKSTGRHRARRPSDTDETTPAPAPPPEHTLREVLESAPLDVPARVAADRLLEEIAERGRAQDARIAELERKGTWWQRARAVAGTVGAAGLASALAVVAAQLIAHGDARAEARQQAAQVQRHGAQLLELARDLETIRLQVTADHTLLQICAARLGAAQQGVP